MKLTKISRNLIALAALTTAGLFAQTTTTTTPTTNPHQGRGIARLAAVLSLNTQQTQQAQTIFQNAHTSAQAVQSQLKTQRHAVQSAIQSGQTPEQVQTLAAAEGANLGQLAGIHASAMAQFYAILTPDQQQKFVTLQQTMPAGGLGMARFHR